MSETVKGLQQQSKKDIKVEKVVKNPVKVKKKGKFAQFIDQFFVEDFKSVLSWGLSEVIVPSLKRLLVEFVDNTANSMVYGKGAGERRRPSSVGNVSYREYYTSSRARDEAYNARHEDIYSYGVVDVQTRDEAEDVLRHMHDHIRTYGFITVGHFLEMVNVPPRQTDFNYGWTSIAGAKYVRLSNGRFQLSLPRVMQID